MNIISNLQRTRLIQRRRKTNDTTVYLSLQKNLWKQVPSNSTQHDGSYKVIIGVTGVSLFRRRVKLRPVGGRAITTWEGANEWGGRGEEEERNRQCWGGGLTSLPFSLHQAPLGALTQVTGLWETLWEPSSLPEPPPPPSPKIWRTLLTSSLFVR